MDEPEPVVVHDDTRPSPLDVRRERNRQSMRRARMRQRAADPPSQGAIGRTCRRHAGLVVRRVRADPATDGALAGAKAAARRHAAAVRGLQEQSGRRDAAGRRRLARPHHAAANRSSTAQSSEEEVPAGRMPVSAAQQLIQAATDMFVANAERTDAVVPTANVVLGWRDKRAVVDGTWAQFLLTKGFPHQSAESLVERTWNATVNVDKLRGMLKWPAGMKVRHRLSDDAVVVCRELHLPNAEDAKQPICYRYQLIIFRAETPNGFIISTRTSTCPEDRTPVLIKC